MPRFARLAPFLPPLILLAQVLIFFRKVLFGTDHVFPWDFRGYHLPLADFALQSLREGRLPLWDPYTYCGFPQFANPQAQTFYPPAWLFWGVALLRNRPDITILTVLNWQQVLHVLLGGLATYALLRKHQLHRPAALMGATAFQIGAFHAMHIQHLGLVNAGAWLPVAMLAAPHIPLVALALAMVTLAGYPPVTLPILAAVFLFQPWRSWPRIAAGAASSLGLSAIQLVPTLRHIPLSMGPERAQWHDDSGGIPWQAVVSLVSPNYYGTLDFFSNPLPYNPTFLNLFIGISALALVLWSRRPAIAGATLLFAAVMIAGRSPLVKLTYPLLPAQVRATLHFEYFSLPFLFGLALLAAHGANRLRTRNAAIACAICTAELISVGSGTPYNAYPRSREPGVTHDSFEGSTETIAKLRALIGTSTPPSRIEIMSDSMNWASSGPLTHVPTVAGNDPLVIRRYQLVRDLYTKPAMDLMLYRELNNLDSPVPSMLNIGYVLTWGSDVAHPDWPLADRLPGHRAYRNQRVLPRFYLASGTVAAHDLEGALKLLNAPHFSPLTTTIVETTGPPPASSPDGSVTVTLYEPHRIRLLVDARAPVFVASSEVHYPGWTATVSGKPAPIMLTNGAFRGVSVPAGKHQVEMRFAPDLATGAWISGAALTLVLLWIRGSRLLP